MSKLFATVLFSFSVSTAWAQSKPADPKAGSGSSARSGSRDDSRPRDPDESERVAKLNNAHDLDKLNIGRCDAKIDERISKRTKFLGFCRVNGKKTIEECSELLSKCEEMSSDDMGGVLDSVLGSFVGEGSKISTGNKGNECSKMAYTEYQSTLRDLERRKTDIEDKLRDLQDKDNRNAEKKDEGESRIQQEINRAEREKAEADRKRLEEERNEESQKSNSINSLREQLRNTNKAILTAQNEQIKLTAVRAQITNEYKTELFNCKLADEARKNNKDPKNQSRVSSGLGSALARRSNQQNNNSLLLQTCLTAAVDKLKARRAAYDAQMRSLEDDMASANERMQEIQKSIALLNEQSLKAKADRAEEQQKTDMAHRQAQLIRQKELVQMMALYKKRATETAQDIFKTNMAINQAAYKVSEHESDKPTSRGSKNDMTEMGTLFGEFSSVSCTQECAGLGKREQTCADAMGEGRASGSRPSSAPAGAADGQRR